MTTVFADAFYYFALVNPDDRRHDHARDFTSGFTGQIVTTAWILTELGDGLAKGKNRLLFLEMVSDLRADPDVRIVTPSTELFVEALHFMAGIPTRNGRLRIASHSSSWSEMESPMH